MSESICPNREDLERFLLGRVSSVELEKIENHLTHCESCLRAIEDMNVHDSLLEAFRHQTGRTDSRLEDRVESLIQRLTQLPQLTVAAPCENSPPSAKNGTDVVMEVKHIPGPHRKNDRRLLRKAALVGILIVLFVAACLYGPTLFRAATNCGELMVQTDRDVLVVLYQGGQRVRILHAEKTHSFDVKAGDYDVELVEAPAGTSIFRQHLHLERGSRAVISAIVLRAMESPFLPNNLVLPLTLRGVGTPVRAVAFCSDGRHLAAAGAWKAKVWDLATGKESVLLEDEKADYYSLTFSPDGKQLAAGGSSFARLWDMQTGRMLLQKGMPGEVNSLAYSPDGRLVLSACAVGNVGRLDGVRGHVSAWRADTGADHIIYASDAEEGYFGATYSSDGKQVAAKAFPLDARGRVLPDGVVRVWEAESGKRIHTFHFSGVQSQGALAFSPDSQLLAVAGGDGSIHLWKVKEEQELSPLSVPGEKFTSIAFSSDGRRLVSGGENSRAVRIWDLATGKPLLVHHLTHSGTAVAINSDGRLVAAGGGDAVSVWNTTQATDHE